MVLHCINLIIFLTIVNSINGDIFDHKDWKKLEQEPGNMQCGRIQSPEGDADPKKEFPWMAKLIRLGTRVDDGKGYLVYHCAGTLISKQIVVTAASCLHHMHLDHIELGTSDVSEFLRYGILQRLYQYDTTKHYFPEEEIAFPDYLAHAPRNDFGWISLNSTVTLTDNIYPICLPRENKAGSTVEFIMAGWSFGAQASPAEGSTSVLKKEVVTGMTTEDCTTYQFSALFDDNNMCADGIVEFNQEGGGPLMRIDEFNGQKHYFIYGVARKPNSEDCGTSRLFSNVYKYLANILDTVELKIYRHYEINPSRNG